MLAAARYLAFLGIVRLTVRLMRRMASDAFWRVQRFSTDWHANNFAGSIVRRITRGMWAVDMLDDTLLLALLPALLVLIGCPLLLGLRWPGMGLLVAAGALVYVSITVALSLGWIAPAARLSNAQDTRLGGALADCHHLQRGGEVVRRRGARGCAAGDRAGQVGRRTRRTWMFASNSGLAQMVALLALRTLVVGCAIWLWWRGRASAGDVTFVLTSYFIMHGYLRDTGQHIANLQRGVNEMEEMVGFQTQPLGVADRADAKPIRVRAGEIVFDHVTFRYGMQVEPLFRDFCLRIAPASASAWSGIPAPARPRSSSWCTGSTT